MRAVTNQTIFFIALTLAVMACRENPPAAAPVETPRISATTRCLEAAPNQCDVVVTVAAAQEDVEIDVLVHADAGVEFLPAQHLHQETRIEDAEIWRVRLFAGENRQIIFPIRPYTVSAPGAYLVNAQATYSGSDRQFGRTTCLVYMETDAIGRATILPSEAAFNERYWANFIAGDYWIEYRLDLDQPAQPTSGRLLLKVSSAYENFQPTILLESHGGVTFYDSGNLFTVTSPMTMRVTPPRMNVGESRIVSAPVRLESNIGLLDGRYLIFATLSSATPDAAAGSERVPIYFVVNSSPGDISRKWLSGQPLEGAPAITPTANPTPNTTDTSSLALTDKTRSLSGANMGTGGIPAVATSHALVDCEDLTVTTAGEPPWEKTITLYEGNLCAAYYEFAHEKYALSWTDFRDTALFFNYPYLEQDNLYLFRHKTYLMPGKK
ncbi:MAG: hypothetical protein IPM39_21940 [Chloroflexi bacterium]|nr:hypothetical protein [Chloroflexota bacterium]